MSERQLHIRPVPEGTAKGIREAAGELGGLETMLKQVESRTLAAAKAQNTLASATAAAAKAAKKSLASFDELNRMEAPAETSGGSSGGRSSSKVTVKAEPDGDISPWQRLLERIRVLLQPVFEAWEAAWLRIREICLAVWNDLMLGVANAWAVYGQPILDAAALAVQNLVLLFQTLWTTVLQPILAVLGETLGHLWTEHLLPLWNDLTLLFGAVVLMLLELWNGVLVPLLQWLTDAFGPVVTEVFTAAASLVSGCVGLIVDALDVAVIALRGVADFLSAVFRGDWDAAWEAIGDTVDRIWARIGDSVRCWVNAIIGFVNGMIRAVVNGVNGVIGVLNGLNFTVPGWVPGIGGQQFGFSLAALSAPQIPYLAQGAVIPPNREFLAVLGDQTHGTNIEAPLETIELAVANVMREVIDAGLAGFEEVVAVLREILQAVLGIEIGDEVIGRAAERYSRRLSAMKGGLA